MKSQSKYNIDPSVIQWDAVEEEVVRKFRYLKMLLTATPEPMREKIMEDLIVPNITLLANFCSNIEEQTGRL